MTMQVEIVSAEESFYSGPAEFVAAPSILGEVGIYPRHAPMLTRIKPGSVRVKRAMSDEEDLIYVSGGILEVQPDIVTVLADSAIRGADLDEAKALEAKLRAQDAMKNREAAMEFASAEAELAEAIAQLAAIEKLRKKR